MSQANLNSKMSVKYSLKFKMRNPNFDLIIFAKTKNIRSVNIALCAVRFIVGVVIRFTDQNPLLA